MANNVWERIQLKEDLAELVNANQDIASLYMNIQDHILRKAGHGQPTKNPQGIKISDIYMNNTGSCAVCVEYP